MAHSWPFTHSPLALSGPSSSENEPFANRGARYSAPAALRQMVSSSSELPSHKRTTESNSTDTMEQLVEQYRAFRLTQQKLHDEERKMWEKERAELHHRIHQLEDNVSSLLYKSSSNMTSPTNGGASSGVVSLSQPQLPTNGTGMERLRETKSEPLRNISNTSETSLKPGGRLASIPERGEPPERKKSVGFATDDHKQRGTSIPGELVNPSYDGINLKPKLLPPEIVKNVTEWAVDSPTSLHSPSPLTIPATPLSKPVSEPRPKLIEIPIARLNSEALYTEDAGHTPLAHVTGDDEILSSKASPKAKPLEFPMEAEHTPFEPPPSVRQPAEKANSYFPAVLPDGESQKENMLVPDPPTDDLALKGPLSLSSSNTKQADVNFLDRVNSELELQASKQLFSDGRSDNCQGKQGRDRADSVKDGDDDGGPKLRLKNSMNFGAPLGKGF